MAESVKISYSATTTRIRCEFSRKMALTLSTPPADILKRAIAKMEAVKVAGTVAAYTTYEPRFLACWKALREDKASPEDRIVSLTLAAGSPNFIGLTVEANKMEKSLITIAATNAARSNTWQWECFKHWICLRMLELGIKESPNNAQLFGAFTRLSLGETPAGQIIGAVPGTVEGSAGKTLAIVGNKQRQEIAIIIRNSADLRDRSRHDKMLAMINQATRQMSVDDIEYRVLKKDFLAALHSAVDGPEGLGLELPLALIAAIGSSKSKVASSVPSAKAPPVQPASATQPAPPTAHGNDLIKFQISPDQMLATITGFNKNLYNNPNISIDLKWVKAQMHAATVTLAMPEELEAPIAEAIEKRADLNGLVCCQGSAGRAGKGIYLHHTYKDAASRVQGDIEGASLDLRMLQQRSTVVAGQIVAEIRFKEAAIAPRNIFGIDLPALSPSETLEVHVGEGLTRSGLYAFIAQRDGIPVIEGANISISPTLVHQGDVNLSTGNLVFDGPIEIHGNVETGAIIHGTGNVIVHGTISGAQISVKGDLIVDAGISTGTTGQVVVGGSITTQFIEQSTIICQGDITVRTAIMNSMIYCSGKVEVAAGGLISGGNLVVLGTMTTGSFGSARGSITTANVGVNWKTIRSMEIKKNRIEKLKKRLNDDRLALRDLTQKKPAQMTAKHHEAKNLLQKRLPRLRTIVDHLELGIAKASTTLTYNATSRLIVRDTLFANVHITVGGQFVPIMNDVMEVAVNPKRIRGSFISALEGKAS